MPFRFNLAVALAVLATMPCFSVSAQPASFRFELLPSPDIDVYYKRPTGPLFHPTLAKAYVSDQFAGRTTVYDTATWDPVVLLEHAYASHSELTPVTEREAFRGYPNAAAFSHGGKYLWTTYSRWSDNSRVTAETGLGVIDAHEDKLLKGFDIGSLPLDLAVNESSTILAILLRGTGTIALYDISQPLLVKKVRDIPLELHLVAPSSAEALRSCGDCPLKVTFLPGTNWLVVSSRKSEGALTVYDALEGKHLAALKTPYAKPQELHVQGGWLYVSFRRHVARVPVANFADAVSTQTLKGWESRELKVSSDPYGARALAVTPDAVFVAIEDTEKLAILSPDLKKLTYVRAPNGATALAASPKNLLIAAQGKYEQGPFGVVVYSRKGPGKPSR